MTIDEKYMIRCINLARLGGGSVAPNPMVGAVLVKNDQIIGEGWHKEYGKAHAEVNAIDSLTNLNDTTLYVSLEPCAHFGKTPPCTDLIINHQIPRVVIGCRDPFEKVNGRGIDKLKEAGINVSVGILEKDCKDLNKRFFTFQKLHRPYIILKWAQTADGFIGSSQRLYISNQYTNRIVHKWRSEEASILIGRNTALNDDPALTNRLWTGPDPIRLVIDIGLQLPSHLKIFDKSVRTIVFNSKHHDEDGNLLYYQVTQDVNLVHQVIHALYQMNIQSVLVEGGARLLQSFIDEDLWDECRIITNNTLFTKAGLSAPSLQNSLTYKEETYSSDTIKYFQRSLTY